MKTNFKKLLFTFLMVTGTIILFSCSNDDDHSEETDGWKELSLEELANNGYEFQASLNERSILNSAISTDTYNMFDPENGLQTTDYLEQIQVHYSISKENISILCWNESNNPLVLRYTVRFGNNTIISQDPHSFENEITTLDAKNKSMLIGFTNKNTGLKDYVRLTNYKIMKQVEYRNGVNLTRYKTTFTSTYDLGQGRTKVVNWEFYTPS